MLIRSSSLASLKSDHHADLHQNDPHLCILQSSVEVTVGNSTVKSAAMCSLIYFAQMCEVDTLIITASQMKNWRHREIKNVSPIHKTKLIAEL